MKPIYTGLVGDVGGTNARFALLDPEGRVRHLHVYEAKNYASLNEVIGDYLHRTVGRKAPPRAVIAVAGPVVDGEIEFTNLNWQVSEGELLAQFEFEAVKLINDFAAQALACPLLTSDSLRVLAPRSAARRTSRWWSWAPAPASASRAWRAANAATWPSHRGRSRRLRAQRRRRGRGLEPASRPPRPVSIERLLSAGASRALRRAGGHETAPASLADERRSTQPPARATRSP